MMTEKTAKDALDKITAQAALAQEYLTKQTQLTRELVNELAKFPTPQADPDLLEKIVALAKPAPFQEYLDKQLKLNRAIAEKLSATSPFHDYFEKQFKLGQDTYAKLMSSDKKR